MAWGTVLSLQGGSLCLGNTASFQELSSLPAAFPKHQRESCGWIPVSLEKGMLYNYSKHPNPSLQIWGEVRFLWQAAQPAEMVGALAGRRGEKQLRAAGRRSHSPALLRREAFWEKRLRENALSTFLQFALQITKEIRMTGRVPNWVNAALCNPMRGLGVGEIWRSHARHTSIPGEVGRSRREAELQHTSKWTAPEAWNSTDGWDQQCTQIHFPAFWPRVVIVEMETDLSGTPRGAQLRKQEAEMVGTGEQGRSVACVQNYTRNGKPQWLCILG